MPRKYIHVPGTRLNRNYTEEDLSKAVESVATKQLTAGKASQMFKIPKQTLLRHIRKQGELRRYGGQTVLSATEETYLIETINIAAKWGFPMNTYDIR